MLAETATAIRCHFSKHKRPQNITWHKTAKISKTDTICKN